MAVQFSIMIASNPTSLLCRIRVRKPGVYRLGLPESVFSNKYCCCNVASWLQSAPQRETDNPEEPVRTLGEHSANTQCPHPTFVGHAGVTHCGQSYFLPIWHCQIQPTNFHQMLKDTCSFSCLCSLRRAPREKCLLPCPMIG